MIFVDEEKCTLCGDCIEACLSQALSLVDGKLIVDRDLCTECGACLRACLFGAIYEVQPRPVVTVIPSAAAVPQPETPAAAAPVERRGTPTLSRVASSPVWLGALPLTARFVAGLADWWLDRRRVRLTAWSRGDQTVSRRRSRDEALPAMPPTGSPGRRRRWRGGRGR
jgi:NAD-dependent dihydropyrimidine dehydrogenase PreA subunit